MRHCIKRSAVVANGTTRNAIGVDIGDKKSRVCVLGVGSEILEETVIQTSTTGFIKYFERADQALVAFEIGTHSAWVEQVLRLTGHDVIAANPRKLALISKSNHKTDKRDAMTLAYLAAQSPHLLSPVKQRSPDMRNDLTLLHARAMLVEERTALVNSVRGFVKPTGKRVPTSISTHAFHTKAEVHIPGELKEVLAPLLIVIQSLTQQIDHYDREIEKLCNEKYPQTKRLRQVAGVGPISRDYSPPPPDFSVNKSVSGVKSACSRRPYT
jgi:transposase